MAKDAGGTQHFFAFLFSNREFIAEIEKIQFSFRRILVILKGGITHVKPST
jgi:hypothetical protein